MFYAPKFLIKPHAPINIEARIVENMNAIIEKSTDGSMLANEAGHTIADAIGLTIVPEGMKQSVPLYQIAFGCEAGVFVSVSPDAIAKMIKHFNDLALDELTLEERCDPDTFFRSRCGAIKINDATRILADAAKSDEARSTMRQHYATLTSHPDNAAIETNFGAIKLRLHPDSIMTALHDGNVIGGYLKGNFMIKPEYRGRGLGAMVSAAKTFMPINNNHYLAVSSGEYSEAGFRTKVAALRLLRERFDMSPVSEKKINDLHEEGIAYHQKIEGLKTERRVRRSEASPVF